MMNDRIRNRVSRFVTLGVICVCACVLARTARAQQEKSSTATHAQEQDLNAVAAKVAQELEAKKAKKVAVFDFAGPGDDRTDLTALGQKLADDFSAALAKSGGKIHVEDRAKIAATVKKFDYRVSDLRDPNFGDVLLAHLGVNVAVVGTLRREGDEFVVSVRATHAGENGAKFIETEHFRVPALEDTLKLAGTYLERAEAVPETAAAKAVSNAGTHGYTYPACLYCPQAQFSDLAGELNLKHATVVLIGTVTPEGTLTDIHVLKHAPGGLAENAVEAVQKWRFRPANGPDGKPAPVRQIIEVSFNMY